MKLTKNINHNIENQKFISLSKGGNVGRIYRKRKLTVKNVTLMLLKFKRSIQRGLNRFYKKVSQNYFNIWEVTKGSFIQARS